MSADRTASALAAECVRQAYENVRDDPRVRARWIERYISANGPLISEADSRWRKHLRHAEEALSELEAAGDALSRLKREVVAERGDFYWQMLIVELLKSGALTLERAQAERLMDAAHVVRATRANRAKEPGRGTLASLNRARCSPTRATEAVEAAQHAYHIVLSTEDGHFVVQFVNLLVEITLWPDEDRSDLALDMAHALSERWREREAAS